MVFFVLELFLGKIKVESPKYDLIKSTDDYEIRKYYPSVIAQITYNRTEMKGKDKDGGFEVLVNYIGAFGKPQNTNPEKIAMTVPVLTQTSEKIAMTVPVVTKTDESNKEMVTMQFILPSKYTKAEEAPKPLDERVVIAEVGERKYGVVKFSGVAKDEVVKVKVENLKKCLERDGFKIVGDFVLARYNPTWSLPFLRTNEVMIPVE